MQRYARVCRGMQGHAGYAAACKGYYAGVCKGMQGYAAACKGMQGYAGVCKGMQGYAVSYVRTVM